MLLIHCPICRQIGDEEEFSFGGPAERRRPANPTALNDAQWAAYLFARQNKRGATAERWRHTYGCRQWFHLQRDTETHEIISARVINPSPHVASVIGPELEVVREHGSNE